MAWSGETGSESRLDREWVDSVAMGSYRVVSLYFLSQEFVSDVMRAGLHEKYI